MLSTIKPIIAAVQDKIKSVDIEILGRVKRKPDMPYADITFSSTQTDQNRMDVTLTITVVSDHDGPQQAIDRMASIDALLNRKSLGAETGVLRAATPINARSDVRFDQGTGLYVGQLNYLVKVHT